MTNSIGDDWDLSYCGLNCARCDIFLASHGDEKLQKDLVKWFKENVDPNIKHVSCGKCRGPTGDCWSSDCKLRACAMKKRLKYCFECSDFVCDKLEKFADDGRILNNDHHKRIVENMKKIQELGLEKWISIQKEAQFCP